jgi:hypothetical protein
MSEATRGSRRLVFHFACNDPRNGLFIGRASACQVGGKAWNLELTHDSWGKGCPFMVAETLMRFCIHRTWFPFAGHREWVGNWCWDAFSLKRPQALRLLLVMRNSGQWSCDAGPTRIARWWNEAKEPRS